MENRYIEILQKNSMFCIRFWPAKMLKIILPPMLELRREVDGRLAGGFQTFLGLLLDVRGSMLEVPGRFLASLGALWELLGSILEVLDSILHALGAPGVDFGGPGLDTGPSWHRFWRFRACF